MCGPRAGAKRCTHPVSQRPAPWIAGQWLPHPARDVRVADSELRIGKSHRPTGAWGPEGARAAKRDRRTRFHESERELDAPRPQALVVETMRRRNRWRGEQVQRVAAEAELTAAGRE